MRLLSLRILLLGALGLNATALRPVDPNAKAGYFVHNDTAYVVAMNFVQNGDIYIHMSAPTSHSWVGVGIGEHMAGAFMLISYACANGTGMTTSPRIATGHSEPDVADGVVFEKIWDDAYSPASNTASHAENGIMISHGVCRNCSGLSRDGALNFGDTAQRFLFAIGPKRTLHSDEPDAPLRRHDFYGHFTMDMTVATTPLDFSEGATYGRVPAPNSDGMNAVADSTFATAGASLAFDASEDSDVGIVLHAVMMLLAYVVLFPVGALLLRILESILWHAVVQALGVVLVLVGFGTAVYISKEYNLSKSFSSAHQMLGLLIFAALLVQLGLGLSHHIAFRRTKKPTLMGRAHLFLGPAIIFLALVNGGLGFNLAGNSAQNTPYVVVVVVLGITFLAVRAWMLFWHGPQKYKHDQEALAQYEYQRQNSGFSPHAQSGYHDLQTPVSAVSRDLGYEMKGREDFLGQGKHVA